MRLTSASLAMVLALTLAGCGAETTPERSAGNPDQGRLLLRQYGCAACHTIPGVATADGNVGPSLANIAARVYIAGVLPNSPENLARWIRAPQEVDPRTAMPDMQVTEAQARDMVAYLHSLR